METKLQLSLAKLTEYRFTASATFYFFTRRVNLSLTCIINNLYKEKHVIFLNHL